jgi:hypothetical protein
MKEQKRAYSPLLLYSPFAVGRRPLTVGHTHQQLPNAQVFPSSCDPRSLGLSGLGSLDCCEQSAAKRRVGATAVSDYMRRGPLGRFRDGAVPARDLATCPTGCREDDSPESCIWHQVTPRPQTRRNASLRGKFAVPCAVSGERV